MKATEILAVYGALLSTVVFIWNVIRTRPKVKVKLVTGMDDFTMGVYIFIQNPSSSAVHVSSISVLYPYKEIGLREAVGHILRFRRLPLRLGWVSSTLDNYAIKDGCPVSIEPGKSHNVFLPDKTLDEMLEKSVRREIIACAQDQLWNDTYSARFQVRFRSTKNEERT